MTCRCPYCLWSPREPNEMRRLETDIAGRNAEELYLRWRREMRRVPPAAVLPGRDGQSSLPPSGTVHAAGGAVDAHVGGDGELEVPTTGKPYPVPLNVFRLIRRWLA